MRNITIILALLLTPYWALIPAHVGESVRAQIGISLVFAFTGLGHFIKTSEMTEMLPVWMPKRVVVIYLSGILELFAAIAILIPTVARSTGLVL